MRAGRTAEECEEILPQLTTLARQIKEELSAQSESSRSFFDAEHFKTYEFRYTQNDLLDLLEEHDFFVTLNDVLNNAVNMAEAGGISRSQIERVLLVGGTTLIPAVQRGIRGIFGREKVQCHKPFEAGGPAGPGGPAAAAWWIIGAATKSCSASSACLRRSVRWPRCWAPT